MASLDHWILPTVPQSCSYLKGWEPSVLYRLPLAKQENGQEQIPITTGAIRPAGEHKVVQQN